MRKKLEVLVAMGLIALTAGGAGAQSDFDYKSVNPLRWMDPNRNPITYQEYRGGRQFAGEFDPGFIYSGG
ncbi:MAG: hypothetical protein WBC42_09815, partial [Candidatus Zixiibacteriota bacterium]